MVTLMEREQTMSSPEQDTTWSSSCPRWGPPPRTPLCRTDPRSAAGRSPLPRWRMKTAPLPDCGWDGSITLQAAQRYGEQL